MKEILPDCPHGEQEGWACPTCFRSVVHKFLAIQKAGFEAQNQWEAWIKDQLEGTHMFNGAMKEAKKNRAKLGIDK